MFRVFDEGFLGGTTVAFLVRLLINGMTFVLFFLAVWLARCPGILEMWQLVFLALADARAQGASRERLTWRMAGLSGRTSHARRPLWEPISRLDLVRS